MRRHSSQPLVLGDTSLIWSRWLQVLFMCSSCEILPCAWRGAIARAIGAAARAAGAGSLLQRGLRRDGRTHGALLRGGPPVARTITIRKRRRRDGERAGVAGDPLGHPHVVDVPVEAPIGTTAWPFTS